MNHKHGNVILFLGVLAIILGSLTLSTEFLAIQFFHYYIWANNIAYKLPLELIANPAILVALLITLCILILGLIFICIWLLKYKNKNSSVSTQQ